MLKSVVDNSKQKRIKCSGWMANNGNDVQTILKVETTNGISNCGFGNDTLNNNVYVKQ